MCNITDAKKNIENIIRRNSSNNINNINNTMLKQTSTISGLNNMNDNETYLQKIDAQIPEIIYLLKESLK